MRAVGCSLGDREESTFEAGGVPLLVPVLGSKGIDTDAVGPRIGARIGEADGRQVKGVTGYSIGAVPPTGYDSPVGSPMDETLLVRPEV